MLYTVIGVVLAIALVLALDARVDFSLSTALWFEVLIYIVVAAFLLEPWFSGASAALANSVATVFIVLGAGFPANGAWWGLLLAAAALGLLCLVVASLLGEGQDRPHASVAAELRGLGSAMGSWRFLMVGVLAVALTTFNRSFGDPWTVSAAVMVYCFAVIRLQPLQLVPRLRGLLATETPELTVRGVYLPHEAVAVGPTSDQFSAGDLVSLSSVLATRPGIVASLAVSQGSRAVHIISPEVRDLLPLETRDSPPLIVVSKSDDAAGLAAISEELENESTSVFGVTSEGSSMQEAVVEIADSGSAELGQVLWAVSAAGRTYWQVTNATVAQATWGGDRRRTVLIRAAQIGRWDNSEHGFVPHTTSPAAADVVLCGKDVGLAAPVTPAGLHVVGTLPSTSFPVAIDVARLGRHHVAVLGTTGTGKTHLAFDLVAALAASGSKVICVDATGQYSVRFPPGEAVQIDWASLPAFLAGDDKIGVYTGAPNVPTVLEGNRLARKVHEWATAKGALAMTENARCVVVFEEAQNYVPEAFVVNDWDWKAKAQDTSLVVMESRKFGLGFILVSQRTAMVTKSALSQCNTIFAFQAVDQTGLDYLEGLCGSAMVKGVPTLPHRTAIAMGRGLTSRSPLIFYVGDAVVEVA